MVFTRRQFFKKAGLLGAGLWSVRHLSSTLLKGSPLFSPPGGRVKPVVISTWKHGMPANKAAAEILAEEGGKALDAVEGGVRVPEGDPKVSSVGYGGLPNEEGEVELDAAIMDGPTANAGSVGGLKYIKHPISVARRVMERSDHVMLVGKGALKFALAHGFRKENLLTNESRRRWLKWKENLSNRDDWFPPPEEAHDTIGMVALDSRGDLAVACTTSGLPYKIPGRVGDSPIIGAGLYVDNEVGGASATGRGEAVIKISGSFLIVELMRRGLTPQEACEEALKRIIKKNKGKPQFQVAFIALNKKGEIGAASIYKIFEYALWKDGKFSLNPSKFLLERTI